MSVPLCKPLTRNEILAKSRHGDLTVVLEMSLDEIIQDHRENFEKYVESCIFANHDGILRKQKYRIVGHAENEGCGQVFLEVTGTVEFFEDTEVFAVKASSLDLCTTNMPVEFVYENRTFILVKRVTDHKTGDLIMFIYKPKDNNSDDRLHVLVD